MDRKEHALKLADLVLALRKQLRDAEAEFDALLAPASYQPDSPQPESLPQQPAQSQNVRGLSVPDKCQSFLDQHAPRIFNPEDIAAGIDEPIHNVRNSLSRLAERGKIVKAGRGEYQSREVLFLKPPEHLEQAMTDAVEETQETGE